MPSVEELADKYQGRMKFCSVDTSGNGDWPSVRRYWVCRPFYFTKMVKKSTNYPGRR
jgi:hypothetical protein